MPEAYKRKAAVLSLGLFLTYAGMWIIMAAAEHKAKLADAGIFPTCTTGILRNYVDFIGLALVFRSFVLIQVPAVKEKEVSESALEPEEINLLTEKITALRESQDELLKRLSVQEARISRLERQLLRQCQRQKTDRRRLAFKSRKYIRISGSDQDDI